MNPAVPPADRRGRRRGRRPGFVPPLLIAATLLALMPVSPASLAAPAEGRAIPQPTRVERFNPDQQTCQPQRLKASFATQLQPWADQPEAVLAQLRRVQLDMTRATLQRCVSKGLMQPAEASQLERELGLQAAPATSPAPTSGAAAPGSAGAKP
jgi:hypothetical protein